MFEESESNHLPNEAEESFLSLTYIWSTCLQFATYIRIAICHSPNQSQGLRSRETLKLQNLFGTLEQCSTEKQMVVQRTLFLGSVI